MISDLVLVEEADLALLHLHSAQAASLFTLLEQNRDYLAHWLCWPQSIHSVADFQHFIRSALLQLAQRRALQCVLCYRGTWVGMCGFQSLNHSQKQAQLGYWLAEPWQGRGIVTRACRLLLKHGFGALDLEKIVIATAAENYPSRAVCERLGFVLERRCLQAEPLHDRRVDHLIYALDRMTWQASLHQ